MHAGRDSDAIMLSAKFHIGIAEIAGHSILTSFVKDLLSRSSLIIALYWRRRDTTCESHAHHALVDAIERHDAQDASDLMKSHLVDLLSGLDLTLGEKKPESLSDILALTRGHVPPPAGRGDCRSHPAAVDDEFWLGHVFGRCHINSE